MVGRRGEEAYEVEVGKIVGSEEKEHCMQEVEGLGVRKGGRAGGESG